MTTALLNGIVLTPAGFERGRAVLVEAGKITALTDAGDPRVHVAAQHDLAGCMLLPGFIDCQVNGGGGVLFNDAPDIGGIRAIAAAHRRFGTTGLLPTLISDREEVMRDALAAVDAAVGQVPGVLGIHIEGPYLSPARKGVHAEAALRSPNRREIALITSLERGCTVLTLAPECAPAEVLRDLLAAGVVVSVGHTAADYVTVRRALDVGVRGFTHLFNAMTPLQGRAPGAVGAALEDRESWCGIIVDGHHVHPTSLKIALAAKPKGKLFLVTDAMPPVGASRLDFVLNGETIVVKEGIARAADGRLAGSVIGMIDAVRNCVDLLGLPLEEAVRMASTYPAEFLGLGSSHGRIAPGYRADFTVIDAAFAVRETWIDGVCERP